MEAVEDARQLGLERVSLLTQPSELALGLGVEDAETSLELGDLEARVLALALGRQRALLERRRLRLGLEPQRSLRTEVSEQLGHRPRQGQRHASHRRQLAPGRQDGTRQLLDVGARLAERLA